MFIKSIHHCLKMLQHNSGLQMLQPWESGLCYVIYNRASLGNQKSQAMERIS